MTGEDEYHTPEWDCTDDIIEVTEEIGKVASKMLLHEFVSRAEAASKDDIKKILQDFAQRNVEAALALAAKGLQERLDADPTEIDDRRIDVLEAIRIVRELDYTDDD